MTSEQHAELIAKLDELIAAFLLAGEVGQWWLTLIAIASVWQCGQFTWRLVIYAKNQRDFF
jgi:hypothetical protein